jgi:inositol hexakisphosphate/diphosphoinositol-pentakisphosphate kinase
MCDYLIAFCSEGFPFDKVITCAQLRQPFCANDLPMQQVLRDHRLCLALIKDLEYPPPSALRLIATVDQKFRVLTL